MKIVPKYDCDFYSDDFIKNPFQHYAEMRALGPVVYIPKLNNYAITLKDERTDGEVTYIFNRENYKRYKDGLVISQDGWRYSKLGALRIFNGDIKLTWKIKIGKENIIVIKPKFQPIGKEYDFSYQLKNLFLDQIQ